MASKVTKLKTAKSTAPSTTPKTGTAKVKTAARAKAVETTPDPAARPQLRMRDVIERVMDRSGMKKGEARSAIEASMAVLADAIERGEDLDLPDLGKLKLQREKVTDTGGVYTLRLIRKRKAAAPNEALAEAGKEG